MSKRTGWLLAFLGLTVVGGYFVWVNRYNIYDWSALQNYTPTAQITKLADDSGMNKYGHRLFYVNNPQVSIKEDFAKQCVNTEQTIVLGCYTGTNIYIYDVSEPKLEGVEEVTAAHEMLHAAYDRLSPSERNKVDILVNDAYKRINNPRISQLADSYRKQDPAIVPNELHSILGTEVRNLGPELETYYSKYFTDRNKVVSLSEQYEKVFEDIKTQVESLDGDLAIRKAEIDKREQNLTALAQKLSNQKAQMDAMLGSGRTQAYNSQVDSYNSAVNSYNAEVANIKRLIAEYNVLVEKRNSIAVQQESLAKSIDSRLDTISQ
jgi:uncharacterized protein YukE